MHNIKCGEKCENFQMKIILLLFFCAYFYAIFDCVEKIDFLCYFSNFQTMHQHVDNAKRKKRNHFLFKLVAIKNVKNKSINLTFV